MADNDRPERDEIAAVLHGIDPEDRRIMGSDPCCQTARIMADRLIAKYDVRNRTTASPDVCGKCHNFVDTPGHVYGCIGLAEAGVEPYAGHKLPL